MKYKFKRIDQLPQHIQGNCYVITDDGHTMFPDDVAKRLNDLERALFNAPEKASPNTAYTKCVEELMRDISGRRVYDLFECDEDIVDDIKQSLEAIIRTHFA